MKKCIIVSLLLFVSLLIVSASAMATTTGTDLQPSFDLKTWGLDAQDQITMPGSWTLPIASTAFSMGFHHESSTDMAFGIYSIDDMEVATVFDSNDTPAANAIVSFDAGSVLVLQYKDAGKVLIDNDSYAFTGQKFGFWFQNGAKKYYSDANLNDLDGDTVYGENEDIAFQVSKADSGSYVFTGGIGGDGTFSDIVVQASSIKPVSTPAPGSMVLLGIGILGLAGITRKK